VDVSQALLRDTRALSLALPVIPRRLDIVIEIRLVTSKMWPGLRRWDG
jgi:hypothetical protein